MNQTKIEWVKNPDFTGISPRDARGRFQYQGYTWNPITGCLNGCPYCYARKLANGRLKQRYLANIDGLYMPATMKSELVKGANDPFYPRFWEERLSEPIENPTPMNPAKRKGIFTCDMSDLFGIGIPESWTEHVMTTIKLCPYHRFYLLTKQPQNLIKWSPFPENCWVGVTATNNTSLDKAMLGLADIVASKRYISFEPLLLPVNFSEEDAELLDWLIIGAQTKPYKPPEFEWVREIVEAADKAAIPVFLKDNLEPLLGQDPHSKRFKGYDAERNMLVGLRQEMPK